MQGFLDQVYQLANQAFARKEALVSYNVYHCPYSTQAMYGQIKEELPRVFDPANLCSELSFHTYHRICRDRDIPWSSRCAPDHRGDLWLSHVKAHCFKKTDETAKAGRWNQFHDKHLRVKPDRTVMAIPMVHIGIRKGWWTFEKSPIVGCYLGNYEHIDGDGGQLDVVSAAAESHAEDAAAGPSAPQAAGSSNDPPVPKGVQHSNADVAKVRLRHQNTTDFACNVLLNSQKMRCLDAVVFVQMRVVERFKIGLSSKTYEKQHTFWEDLASGGWSRTLGETWQAICSEEVVSFCGFGRSPDVNEETKREDAAVMDVVLDAALHMTFLFEVWLAEFTHGLPNYFVLLLSPSLATRTAVPTKLDVNLL